MVYGCKPRWKANGEYCYLFSHQQRNWYDARTRCGQAGGSLVSIASQDEQNYVYSQMQTCKYGATIPNLRFTVPLVLDGIRSKICFIYIIFWMNFSRVLVKNVYNRKSCKFLISFTPQHIKSFTETILFVNIC